MPMKNKFITILDCTLRDGSYLIDYQFTAEDTYIVCLGLERAGFKLIEVGHGTGLRSSLTGKGKAAASDEEYLQAAKTALSGSDARFGMFFIPGIGKLEDLEMAAEYGMEFVRIGTNVTEIDQAKPYIEKAKALGMTVSSNLMKSYAVSIDDFVKLAKSAADYGADVISVVDSAGGMFPEDVHEYVRRLRDITDKKIGFHGHNNLQLAIANSLQAVKAGASIVDSSLQGMGRSAGNAQTEILVMALEKMGYHTGIDPYRTMDLGTRIIRPMMSKGQGVDDVSVIAGIAQFHSSFSKIIERVAKKFKIDPRMLIIEVSEVERVHITEELTEEVATKIAKRMRRKRPQSDVVFISDFVYKKESGTAYEQLKSMADEVISLSKKTGMYAVFSLTISSTGKNAFPFIRKGTSMIIGNCEASSITDLEVFIQYLDGKVDWILLDESRSELLQCGLEKQIIKSSFAWYSEDRALRMSIVALLSQKHFAGKILLLSDAESVAIIGMALRKHGLLSVSQENTGMIREESGIKRLFKEIDCIVSFGKKYAEGLNAEHVKFLKNGTTIYAALPDAFPVSFWESAISQGFAACRVDSRVGFATELNLAIETKKLISTMGQTEIAGVTVVSGGTIGIRGAVVLDSIVNPGKVIGVADGLGGLLASEEEYLYKDSLEKVKSALIKKLYQADYLQKD